MAAIFAPWPLGGNWPFFRFAALIVGTALLATTLVLPKKPSPLVAFPFIWLVVAFGGAYVLFQSLPQSAFLSTPVEVVNTERFAESGLKGIDLQAEPSDVGAISVYPAATREKLVELLLAFGFFVAATVWLTERKSIVNVLWGISFSGVAVTLFGLVQSLSWNGKIFWQIPVSNGWVFGSFVNKNNAAGFLLVTLGAAMFFLARQMIQWSEKRQPSGLVLDSEEWDEVNELYAPTLSERFLRFVAEIQPKHLYTLAATTVIASGVVASLSRGGMLALAGTLLMTFVVLARTNRKLVASLAAILFIGGATFVVVSERSDSVVAKIESLSDVSQAAAPRLAHWNDALPFAAEHLAFGTGAGSYRYVTSSMQSFFFEKIFAHAENVYIETVVEMGLVGVSLLVIAIFIALMACFRLIRQRENFDKALGVGGLASLVGVALASVLDFGIYQPANSIVMAIMMGMVVGRDNYKYARPNAKIATYAIPVFLFLMLISSCWAVYESYGIESRQYATRLIKLINQSEEPIGRHNTKRAFDAIESSLSTAIKIRPDDSEAEFQMGEYHVAKFRTEWARELLSEYDVLKKEAAKTPEIPFEDLSPETIWRTTALSFLHQEYRYVERSNKAAAAQMVSDPKIQDHLKSAYDHYEKAEKNCSRVFKTRIRQAQLSAYFEPGAEPGHLAAALSRNFWNSQILYECGLLALNSGKQDLAVELWARCLSNPHTKKFERPIVEFCLAELSMKRLYEQVLPQNPENLLSVARKYFPSELILPKKYLLIHTKQVISEAQLDETERFYFLAEAERLSEEFELAAKHYQKALELRPEKTLWRFEYAKCLYETKQFNEAVRQLKKCELENSRLNHSIKPLLDRIRRDRLQSPVQASKPGSESPQ
jgi:O-antigen ligase/tetratricopeptide (TPR) repeat protein